MPPTSTRLQRPLKITTGTSTLTTNSQPVQMFSKESTTRANQKDNTERKDKIDTQTTQEERKEVRHLTAKEKEKGSTNHDLATSKEKERVHITTLDHTDHTTTRTDDQLPTTTRERNRNERKGQRNEQLLLPLQQP
eukprot:2324161-Amphidinium_carterae.2